MRNNLCSYMRVIDSFLSQYLKEFGSKLSDEEKKVLITELAARDPHAPDIDPVREAELRGFDPYIVMIENIERIIARHREKKDMPSSNHQIAAGFYYYLHNLFQADDGRNVFDDYINVATTAAKESKHDVRAGMVHQLNKLRDVMIEQVDKQGGTSVEQQAIRELLPMADAIGFIPTKAYLVDHFRAALEDPERSKVYTEIAKLPLALESIQTVTTDPKRQVTPDMYVQRGAPKIYPTELTPKTYKEWVAGTDLATEIDAVLAPMAKGRIGNNMATLITINDRYPNVSYKEKVEKITELLPAAMLELESFKIANVPEDDMTRFRELFGNVLRDFVTYNTTEHVIGTRGETKREKKGTIMPSYRNIKSALLETLEQEAQKNAGYVSPVRSVLAKDPIFKSIHDFLTTAEPHRALSLYLDHNPGVELAPELKTAELAIRDRALSAQELYNEQKKAYGDMQHVIREMLTSEYDEDMRGGRGVSDDEEGSRMFSHEGADRYETPGVPALVAMIEAKHDKSYGYPLSGSEQEEILNEIKREFKASPIKTYLVYKYGQKQGYLKWSDYNSAVHDPQVQQRAAQVHAHLALNKGTRIERELLALEGSSLPDDLIRELKPFLTGRIKKEYENLMANPVEHLDASNPNYLTNMRRYIGELRGKLFSVDYSSAQKLEPIYLKLLVLESDSYDQYNKYRLADRNGDVVAKGQIFNQMRKTVADAVEQGKKLFADEKFQQSVFVATDPGDARSIGQLRTLIQKYSTINKDAEASKLAMPKSLEKEFEYVDFMREQKDIWSRVNELRSAINKQKRAVKSQKHELVTVVDENIEELNAPGSRARQLYGRSFVPGEILFAPEDKESRLSRQELLERIDRINSLERELEPLEAQLFVNKERQEREGKVRDELFRNEVNANQEMYLQSVFGIEKEASPVPITKQVSKPPRLAKVLDHLFGTRDKTDFTPHDIRKVMNYIKRGGTFKDPVLFTKHEIENIQKYLRGQYLPEQPRSDSIFTEADRKRIVDYIKQNGLSEKTIGDITANMARFAPHLSGIKADEMRRRFDEFVAPLQKKLEEPVMKRYLKYLSEASFKQGGVLSQKHKEELMQQAIDSEKKETHSDIYWKGYANELMSGSSAKYIDYIRSLRQIYTERALPDFVTALDHDEKEKVVETLKDEIIANSVLTPRSAIDEDMIDAIIHGRFETTETADGVTSLLVYPRVGGIKAETDVPVDDLERYVVGVPTTTGGTRDVAIQPSSEQYQYSMTPIHIGSLQKDANDDYYFIRNPAINLSDQGKMILPEEGQKRDLLYNMRKKSFKKLLAMKPEEYLGYYTSLVSTPITDPKTSLEVSNESKILKLLMALRVPEQVLSNMEKDIPALSSRERWALIRDIHGLIGLDYSDKQTISSVFKQLLQTTGRNVNKWIKDVTIPFFDAIPYVSQQEPIRMLKMLPSSRDTVVTDVQQHISALSEEMGYDIKFNKQNLEAIKNLIDGKVSYVGVQDVEGNSFLFLYERRGNDIAKHLEMYRQPYPASERLKRSTGYSDEFLPPTELVKKEKGVSEDVLKSTITPKRGAEPTRTQEELQRTSQPSEQPGPIAFKKEPTSVKFKKPEKKTVEEEQAIVKQSVVTPQEKTQAHKQNKPRTPEAQQTRRARDWRSLNPRQPADVPATAFESADLFRQFVVETSSFGRNRKLNVAGGPRKTVLSVGESGQGVLGIVNPGLSHPHDAEYLLRAVKRKYNRNAGKYTVTDSLHNNTNASQNVQDKQNELTIRTKPGMVPGQRPHHVGDQFIPTKDLAGRLKTNGNLSQNEA